MRGFNSWILGFTPRSVGQKDKLGQVRIQAWGCWQEKLYEHSETQWAVQSSVPSGNHNCLFSSPRTSHTFPVRYVSFWQWLGLQLSTPPSHPPTSSPQLRGSRMKATPLTSISRAEFYILLYFHWCVSNAKCSLGWGWVMPFLFLNYSRFLGKM